MSRTARVFSVIIWIIGSALLFYGSYLRHVDSTAPLGNYDIFLILLGIGLIVTTVLINYRQDIPNPEIGKTTAAVLLSVVVIIAIPIKLYHLDTVPYGAHNDEIVKGMQVINFFNGGSFQPFYVANKEFLFFYMLIPFIKFFGVSIIGLRMLPFCCGLGTVIFTYLLFRRLWGQSAAFCAAACMAIGIWPNQSSHICERLNSAPLFTAASLFYTLAAIQTRKFWYFIIAGTIAAAGMWTFPTFRLIPWACFSLIILAFFHGKLSWKKDSWKAILLIIISLIVITAPLNFSAEDTYKTFYSRQGHDFKIAKSSDQIKNNSLLLLKSFTEDCVEDMSFTQLNVPLFWWPLGVFFLIGCMCVLGKPLSFHSQFMVIWLGAALLPAMASEPTVRRLTAAQPALFGLIGLGLFMTISGVAPYINKKKPWGLVPMFAFIIMAGYRNYTVFTEEIAPSWRVAWEDYWIVEHAVNQFDRTEIHVDWIEEEAELPLRYLLYPKTGDLRWFQPEKPQFSIPFTFKPERDFVYLFRNIPENNGALVQLKELYPQGVLSLHQDSEHPRGYYSFTMKKADIDIRRGVLVTSETQNTTLTSFNVYNTELAQFPADQPIILESVVLANSHGQYHFRLHGSSAASIYVNNQKIEPVSSSDGVTEYAVLFTKGPQLFKIILTSKPIQQNLVLQWRVPTHTGMPAPEAIWTSIPSENLLKPPVPKSLAQPSPQEPASYQYIKMDSVRHQHPSGGRTYDISRIEKLGTNKYLGNCWHYQTMVLLDQNAEIVSEWNVNLLDDPQWKLRFDFDIDVQGNVYLVGDSRRWLIVSTSTGDFIRKAKLPADPLAIKLFDSERALILFHHRAAIVSLADGTILTEIGQWGNGLDQYYWPIAITVSANRECFIVDRTFNRIQVYNTAGDFLRSISVPGPLGDTIGIGFDTQGNLLVPHFNSDRIFTISQDGAILTGDIERGSDPLDSTNTHRPRYTFLPDEKTLWITNSDQIHRLIKKD